MRNAVDHAVARARGHPRHRDAVGEQLAQRAAEQRGRGRRRRCGLPHSKEDWDGGSAAGGGGEGRGGGGDWAGGGASGGGGDGGGGGACGWWEE